jgi:hypothetical protein
MNSGVILPAPSYRQEEDASIVISRWLAVRRFLLVFFSFCSLLCCQAPFLPLSTAYMGRPVIDFVTSVQSTVNSNEQSGSKRGVHLGLCIV